MKTVFSFILVLVVLVLPMLLHAQNLSRGEIIYIAHCIACHGQSGKGDGISAPALIPPPPDFSSEEYKASFNKDDVWDSIIYGKEESQMEAFEGKIPEEDVEAVIEYIHSIK